MRTLAQIELRVEQASCLLLRMVQYISSTTVFNRFCATKLPPNPLAGHRQLPQPRVVGCRRFLRRIGRVVDRIIEFDFLPQPNLQSVRYMFAVVIEIYCHTAAR